jgi:hypothetical protein
MLSIVRNLVVGIGALLAAILFGALAQGVLEYALPAFSDRSVGATNVSTYALLVVLGCSFFVVGVAAPRWLRTSVPLIWLLLPVVTVYAVAVVSQPYLYRCNPVTLAACRVVLSPFAVSAAALVAGYVLRWRL